jgi:predicted nucleic acid-binding protein
VYLLNAKLVPERRRQRPHGAVLAWLHSVTGRAVYLCACTIGELQRGVGVESV